MNPRYIQYSWQKYYNQAGAHYTDTSTIEKDMWEENIANKEERRKNITKKVERLRERIEAWCKKNGYDKMENQTELKDKTGQYTYKYSDWEFIDDAYGNMINDGDWLPHQKEMVKYNKLWRKYE